MLHSELWYNPWTSMGSGHLVVWRVSRGSQLHLAAHRKPGVLDPHCCPKPFPPEDCFGFSFWQVSPELTRRAFERLKYLIPSSPIASRRSWGLLSWLAGWGVPANEQNSPFSHQQQVSTEATSWVLALPLTVCGALEKLPVSTALCTYLSV